MYTQANTVPPVTPEFVAKLCSVIDAGLCREIGNPTLGEMSVESAVNYAKDAPHGNEPACVHPSIHSFVAVLNDAQWSSNEARAKGLKRLAIAQLGTAGWTAEQAVEFAGRMALYAVNKSVPRALRVALNMPVFPESHKEVLEEAAKQCEVVTSWAPHAYSLHVEDAAYAARYTADVARHATLAALHASSVAQHAADAARYTAEMARHATLAPRHAAYAADAARHAAYAAAYATSAAYAARYAPDAATEAAQDKELTETANYAVSVLAEMQTQGSQFLSMATWAQPNELRQSRHTRIPDPWIAELCRNRSTL